MNLTKVPSGNNPFEAGENPLKTIDLSKQEVPAFDFAVNKQIDKKNKSKSSRNTVLWLLGGLGVLVIIGGFFVITLATGIYIYNSSDEKAEIVEKDKEIIEDKDIVKKTSRKKRDAF